MHPSDKKWDAAARESWSGDMINSNIFYYYMVMRRKKAKKTFKELASFILQIKIDRTSQ